MLARQYDEQKKELEIDPDNSPQLTKAQTAASDLEHAARIIRNGGVVAFPTETVYGLGANAFDTKAVARIFEIKERPRFDPLIVHIAAPSEVADLADELPAQAIVLAEAFWPGPLTIVFPRGKRVPDIVTSGLSTVAVRMPDHPLALALLKKSGVPIAAPSANRFGCTSPTLAMHVYEQLGSRADMILDGGGCRVGIESTIISFAGNSPVLLRAGGTTVEEIEAVIGAVERVVPHADTPTAPGQLPRHYAPRTPLRVGTVSSSLDREHRIGLLCFRTPDALPIRCAALEVLSARGDLREAAANLFAALHRLDSQRLDYIVAERFTDAGLGQAINDRLKRAAHP